MPKTHSRKRTPAQAQRSEDQGTNSQHQADAPQAVTDQKKKAPQSTATESKASLDISITQALESPRVIVTKVSPCVDGGRYPAKAVVNQPVTINATIFTDGHNRLAARVIWKKTDASAWLSEPMTLLGNDLWEAQILPQETGKVYFRIEAWLDRWQNYHHELYEKHHAGVPVRLELQEGLLLLQEIFDYAQSQDALPESERDNADVKVVSPHQMPRTDAMSLMQESLAQLEQARANDDINQQVHILLRQPLADAVEILEPRQFLTQPQQTLIIDVERTQAGFSSWYELFPRSATPSPEIHGTFDDVIPRLPTIQAMGFDVLYFPPIHPIGERNRKGRNNNVVAGEGDPGSPYAIGSEEGGHDVVYSKLGGIEAFRRLKTAAKEHGLDIAIDFAIQCAPDHPWLREHPGWFSWRPDGSIRYAENPPKKYQDIVNVDFYAKDAQPDMWLAWRDIVLYWLSEGVSIFRVDNPHTKPLPFWEWLISDVRKRHPEAIFLSEAFTRPAMMYQLAKIGFTQSYTYFIWRDNKQELTEYLCELTQTEVKDFYRPNFFVNTPDINPYFLQTSGRPGFLIRSALAATLSGLWGVYSGFELCESAPIPRKEEYLNSEKYEIRPRDYNAPGNIVAEISQLNKIRKENPALQTHLGVQFYRCTNDNVLFFGKATNENENFLLVGVSLDPYNGQEAQLQLPTEEFGLGDNAAFDVTELMRGIDFQWYGRNQHWYFDPNEIPFAIWRLQTRKV